LWQLEIQSLKDTLLFSEMEALGNDSRRTLCGVRKLRLEPPTLRWTQDGGPAKDWRHVIRFGHDAVREAMKARLSGSADAPRLSICPYKESCLHRLLTGV